MIIDEPPSPPLGNGTARANSAEILSETYDLQILGSLRKIIHAVDIHSRELNQRFRVTTPQLICLHCLARQGAMSLSRLAKAVSLRASTTDGIVDRLEAKGLLTRTRSREDRRRVELSITEAGLELTRQAPTPLQGKLSEALRALPEQEQAAIAHTLERVVKLMEADRLAGPTGNSKDIPWRQTTNESPAKSTQ